MSNFKIIKLIETGETFLASDYYLDPSKFTIFCPYNEKEEPVMGKYGIGNEYKSDIEVIGVYNSEKYSLSRGCITEI